MNHSIRTGFSFGFTSGIITTLGLMVGLHSGTHSTSIVIGGILMIAIADALSDALGIHMSEEAENKHNAKEVWQSTIATFFTKLIFALMFIIPVLLFPLTSAIIISIIWGLLLISAFSYHLAKQQKTSPCKIMIEHLAIAMAVILATHFIGDLITVLYQNP